MKSQKIINLLDNTTDQSFKFRTKNWFEVNNEAGGSYIGNSQLEFETSVLQTSLCDYNDAYILVKETITIIGA